MKKHNRFLLVAFFVLAGTTVCRAQPAEPIELSLLLEKFLPETRDAPIVWHHESENPLIEWEEEGYHSEVPGPFGRTGKVFVTAAGKEFWVLKARKTPVPWEVTMAGPKSSVAEILFKPSSDSWGTFASGNEFDFMKSMGNNPRLHLDYLCTQKDEEEGSIENYYALKYKDTSYTVRHKKILTPSHYDQSVMLYIFEKKLPDKCKAMPKEKRGEGE